ncbi:MAG: sarcosine oxidase subunit gamma family protein [Hyphomicrobiaceae bacterium]
MAEPQVQCRSPLTGVAVAGRIGRIIGVAGVGIREITDIGALAIVARKGRIADVAAVLSRHVGSNVPDAAKRTAGNGIAVSGIGPGQWLAMAQSTGAGTALDALRANLDGLAAVTDQGDGRVILEVSGPRARDALAKGIAVDLDPIAFKVGDVAQATASHIGLQIALIDAAPTFEIVSARSTAGSLWAWLTASAAEYGIDVA